MDKLQMSLDEIVNLEQKPSCGYELPTKQEISSVITRPEKTDNWRSRKPSPDNYSSHNRNRRDNVQKGPNWGGIQRRPRYNYNRNGGKAAAWRRDFYSEITRQETSSGKITLSNLGVEVSEEDIGLLFGDIGPLLSCRLDYDRSGRSLGTATVVFEFQSDAIRAVNMYNGAYLDGRLMHMQLVTVYGTMPCWNVWRRGEMNRVFRPNPTGWSQPPYRRNEYSGGRKRSFKELDDELDEYMRSA